MILNISDQNLKHSEHLLIKSTDTNVTITQI